MAANSALIGLAYLNVEWRKGRHTYLDNFVPLVCQVIYEEQFDVVAEADVQEGLLERFGLDLPRYTVGTIIRRAANEDYLRRERRRFKPEYERIAELSFDQREEEVKRLYNAVVGRMREYLSEHLGVTWTEEEAQAALQNYLSNYALEVVELERAATAVPKVEEGPDSELYVGLFVNHIYEHNRGVFDLVVDLFKAALLSNALFVGDLHNVEERFHDTKFFLDGPLLLPAAGYAKETNVAPVRELVELLESLGGEVCCFRSSLEEARGFLVACATIMRKGVYRDSTDPTRSLIDHFWSSNYLSTDVDRFAATLEDKLGAKGIRAYDPPSVEEDYQIDVMDFQSHLEDRLGYEQSTADAVVHDAEAVASVIRLRQGQSCHSLENCEAIFVTHNNRFARVTQEYFSGETIAEGVSPVATDYNITNIAWLKKPTAAPDLPMKQLLAQCEAAIQPSEELWDDFVDEIEHLQEQGDISQEEYYLLRHSREVKVSLTEVTGGDPDAFTGGRVPEVMQRAERRREQELLQSLEGEKEERKEAEEEAAERRGTTQARLETVAGFAGRATRWSVLLGGAAVLGLALYKTFPGSITALDRAVTDYLWSAILVLGFGFWLWSGLFGTGWVNVASKCDDWIYRKVKEELFDWFEI